MDDITSNDLSTVVVNLIRKFNTLMDCPVHFSGEYGGERIQHFIEYIQSYKRIKCITDEQALQELGYLVTDHAYTWWHRRKCHFTTWSDALTALQNKFAKQRPAHVIYKDIFGQLYGEYKSDEDFIDDKYELLTELPDPKLSEKSKLDMIFGLLPKDLQANLEYFRISNLIELKEQILQLKCNQKSIEVDDEESDCNGNNVQCMETKEELNGHEETVIEETECDNRDTTSTVYTVNDKDPIIKVRRTEDLMPLYKLEENETNVVHHEDEEFISTENVSGNHKNSANTNTNFQIDTDIMNQINHIIDESERNCDGICDGLQVSTVMSITESTPTPIAFLLNGETTIQAEVPAKSHPALRVAENPIPRKLRGRCGYCRKYGHKAQVCLKRSKHIKLFPEKFLSKSNSVPADNSKVIKEVVTSNNNNNNNENVNSIIIESATSIPPLVSNVPPLIATSNALISQQEMVTSVASSFSHNTSLPPVPPTFSHITTMSSVPSIFSHATTLTTKLIAPINGPGPNKQLAAKLRNINGPSPKCHQCGTVGFYKSICPNCSPIYNSNQYK